MKRNIVLGAGLTGINYALQNSQTLILEKEKEPGGLCRSRHKNGFIFDYSGHLFHSNNESLKKHLNTFTSFATHSRKASVFLDNNHIPVPIQNNIAFLPKDLKTQAIKDLPPKTNGKVCTEMLFPSWCKTNFGETLYNVFFKPYNLKFWGDYFFKINASWTKGFITQADKKKDSEKKEIHNKGYNATFMYPKKDGIGILAKQMAKKNNLDINYNTEIIKIDIANKCLTDKKGNTFYYKNLINTAPLPELRHMLSYIPDDINKAFLQLKHISVLNLNIALDIPEVFDEHWVYFPENQYSFYRIGCYSNFSKNTCKKNNSTYYLEKTIPTDCDKEKAAKDMIADFVNLFNIREKNIVATDEVYIEYAYVVFDQKREKALTKIEKFLSENNIYLKGRYGAWNYSSMSESLSI